MVVIKSVECTPSLNPKVLNQFVDSTPILKIGDQVPTLDVFWPKHLHKVRSTGYIHVPSR